MRLKKGFTLAEILIVLMVIGVIATLTVPSMMKNVNEAQLKTSYKKAYNTITNLWAMQSVEGTQPQAPGARATIDQIRNNMFVSMLENLSVRDVAQVDIDGGELPDTNQNIGITYEIQGVQRTFGAAGGTIINLAGGNVPDDFWITTDDGISYTVLPNAHDGAVAYSCDTKSAIVNEETFNEAVGESCLTIIADVNGVNKRPNRYEAQATTALPNANALMQTLQSDQYPIFIGRDGVSGGNKTRFATARIIADIK